MRLLLSAKNEMEAKHNLLVAQSSEAIELIDGQIKKLESLSSEEVKLETLENQLNALETQTRSKALSGKLFGASLIGWAVISASIIKFVAVKSNQKLVKISMAVFGTAAATGSVIMMSADSVSRRSAISLLKEMKQKIADSQRKLSAERELKKTASAIVSELPQKFESESVHSN